MVYSCLRLQVTNVLTACEIVALLSTRTQTLIPYFSVHDRSWSQHGGAELHSWCAVTPTNLYHYASRPRPSCHGSRSGTGWCLHRSAQSASLQRRQAPLATNASVTHLLAPLYQQCHLLVDFSCSMQYADFRAQVLQSVCDCLLRSASGLPWTRVPVCG